MKYLLLVALLLFTSCSKKTNSLYTSISLSNAEVISNFITFVNVGDLTYAQVNANELSSYYKYFRANLFNDGIVHWNNNFDCNKFAAMYAALAQVKYATDSFGTNCPDSIAIGEIWYQRSPNEGHAINVIISNQGVLFIDPQNGERVVLTDKQRQSIYFVRF